MFLANSSRISSSLNEWNVIPFSTHIIYQIEKYLKPLSLIFLTLALYVNHLEAIYLRNKWKRKTSLPVCFPSYSRWGQTHPYLNQATQKNNYQVFLPPKIPESKFQTPQNILRSSPSLEGYVSDLHDSSLYEITNNFCRNTSWMSFLSVEFDCCICNKLQISYFSEQVKIKWTSEYWMWNHGDWQWGKIP